MLRVVLAYVDAQQREIPIIDTTDAATARTVAQAALTEYENASVASADPVVAEIIQGELAQARRVLKCLGILESERQPGKEARDGRGRLSSGRNSVRLGNGRRDDA